MECRGAEIMKEKKTFPSISKIDKENISLDAAPQIIKEAHKESSSNSVNQEYHNSYLYLYAAMSKPEISQLTRSFCIDEELKNLSKTLQSWEIAISEFRKIEFQEKEIANSNIPIDINPNPKLNEIENNPLFQKTFSQTPFEFKIVEIDNLVAPQRNVSLGYVEKLTERIPDSPNEDELIDLCISPKQVVPIPKPTQKAQNSWIFSSPSVDFRFLGGYLKDHLTEDDLKFTSVGGLPTQAITLFVGYGAGSINVLRVNNRLILNNGFHRVFALRKKGILKIPVVIQNIGNPELEFPPKILNLTKNYLLTHPRPVLVKDFFNPNLTKIFKRKEMIRTVRIDLGVDMTDLDV